MGYGIGRRRGGICSSFTCAYQRVTVGFDHLITMGKPWKYHGETIRNLCLREKGVVAILWPGVEVER